MHARPWQAALALLGGVGVLGACDPAEEEHEHMSKGCAEETRAEDFHIGLAQEGERTVVEIADAEPSTPIRGDNTWVLKVSDLSGAPMDGMSVGVKPWMPDHGHGTPIQVEVTELGEGQYEATPINLFMAGYWELTSEIVDESGTTDEVVFRVCVE